MRTGIKASVLITAITMSMAISGCGSSYPDLTEEENELVSEYAAALLLKYDSENHSRLVDTTEFMTTYQAAVEAREESIRAYEEEQARKLAEEEMAAKQAEEESRTFSEKKDGTGGATIINDNSSSTPEMSLAEFLNASDFKIDYAGYDLMSRYPEDSSRPISASSGKALLIVYFNVTSENGGTLDVFNENATFKISVNNGTYSSNYITVLDDDLSQYLDSFSAGETKRLVLVFEVSKDTTVSSLDLEVESIFSGSMIKTLTN